MAEHIESCPFCGSPGHVHECDWCDPYEYSVLCTACRAATLGSTDRAVAIEAWNKRTAQSSWANEKAEMERRKDDAELCAQEQRAYSCELETDVAGLLEVIKLAVAAHEDPNIWLEDARNALERHASLPLAAKGE